MQPVEGGAALSDVPVWWLRRVLDAHADTYPSVDVARSMTAVVSALAAGADDRLAVAVTARSFAAGSGVSMATWSRRVAWLLEHGWLARDRFARDRRGGYVLAIPRVAPTSAAAEELRDLPDEPGR